MNDEFQSFLSALEKSSSQEENRMNSMLENIFSMREIGNKTHGDLAEVALTEYINRIVDGYSAIHTGKQNFRAKNAEEDITVINNITDEKILISIKTYGKGPLQLSTDKDFQMFPYLEKNVVQAEIIDKKLIRKILSAECFANFSNVNVLPFIYDEKKMNFKVIVFDLQKAYSSVGKITFHPPRKHGKKKTYPIYKFYDPNGSYIFEVRYGGTNANALQRGMWTHTENAESYFDMLFQGSYTINEVAVKLIPKILNLHKHEQKEILKLLIL